MHTAIDQYIQDYHESRTPFGLHRIDGRVKLAILVAAIFLNIYFAKLQLSIALFVIGVGLAAWSRIPIRLFLLFFIIPAWSTLIVVCGFSIGFGTTVIYTLGPVSIYQEGFELGLAAAARVACDMAWMAAIFLTTPFNALLKALKWYRVPGVFLETLALAFRYFSLFIDEFAKMRISALSRGGFQTYAQSLKTTAKILAQVFLRAYDRSTRIQEAMMNRGEARRDETVSKSNPPDPDECPNQCNITPVYKNASLPVIQCNRLHYSLTQTPVLEDISFSIHKKEIVALCGPNGAGKTTLLKLISGIALPSEGAVLLQGEVLDKKNRENAFRQVGLMCQDPDNQLFCTHVREDVSYGPVNMGYPEAMVHQFADTAMELMEVSDLSDRPIHRLSCGQKKRVGLAGLIAMKPPILLLDEPSANLDPAAAAKLIDHLKHLNEHHGYTLLIVTHDMNLAARIAQRIIILDDGKIVADQSARDILTNEKLLNSSRLEPPILTRMFQRLIKDPGNQSQIPITIDEAVSYLKEQLNIDDAPSVSNKYDRNPGPLSQNPTPKEAP